MDKNIISLDGKKILITGASGGIGLSISTIIARLGGIPIMHYNKNYKAIEAHVLDLKKEDFIVDSIQFDINNEGDVREKIAQIKTKYTTIDGLVNNAGILARGFIATQSVNTFTNIINTNLIGNFCVLKYISQLMIGQRQGNVVNVSSLAGIIGLKGQSAYSASKAGLNALTIIAAKELANYNIRVNAVAPGYIETGMLKEPTANDKKYIEMIPLKRFGTARDVASVVAFLLSDASRYITGQTIIIDGGLSIAL